MYQPKLYKVSWYILKHTILQNIHGKCMGWHLKNKIQRKWKMPIMHFLHTFVKKRRWHLDKSILLSRSTYSIQASFKESKRQFWLLPGATTTIWVFSHSSSLNFIHFVTFTQSERCVVIVWALSSIFQLGQAKQLLRRALCAMY